MGAWRVARALLARANRIVQLEGMLDLAETEYTRMALLLAQAESRHREIMREADGLQDQVDMLRARGCCTVDGGEDARA